MLDLWFCFEFRPDCVLLSRAELRGRGRGRLFESEFGLEFNRRAPPDLSLAWTSLLTRFRAEMEGPSKNRFEALSSFSEWLILQTNVTGV